MLIRRHRHDARNHLSVQYWTELGGPSTPLPRLRSGDDRAKHGQARVTYNEGDFRTLRTEDFAVAFQRVGMLDVPNPPSVLPRTGVGRVRGTPSRPFPELPGGGFCFAAGLDFSYGDGEFLIGYRYTRDFPPFHYKQNDRVVYEYLVRSPYLDAEGRTTKTAPPDDAVVTPARVPSAFLQATFRTAQYRTDLIRVRRIDLMAMAEKYGQAFLNSGYFPHLGASGMAACVFAASLTPTGPRPDWPNVPYLDPNFDKAPLRSFLLSIGALIAEDEV